MYTRSLLKTRLVDRLIKIEIPLFLVVKVQFFYQIEIKEIMTLKINFICRKFSPAEGFMLVCLILMANINLL